MSKRFSGIVSGDERGIAIVEIAVVVPLFLIFLVIGTIEVGQLLIYYQNSMQIVREASRLAAQTTPLDAGDASVSEDGNFDTVAPSHRDIHWRINQLVFLHGIRHEKLVVSTEHRKSGDCLTLPCDASLEDSIEVKIRLEYDSFFPLAFDKWPIEAAQRTTWLYGERLKPRF